MHNERPSKARLEQSTQRWWWRGPAVLLAMSLAVGCGGEEAAPEASELSRAVVEANVALASAGALATASSQASAAYPAAAVNNGDRKGLSWGNGGGWSDGNPGVFPDWVQINFNGSQTIDRIVVYTLQDNYGAPIEPTDSTTFATYGLRNYSVQAWNGTAWDTLGSVTSNNLVKRSFLFAPYTTDRIRVNTTASPDGYSRIVEIEAWGSPASGADTTGNLISRWKFDNSASDSTNAFHATLNGSPTYTASGSLDQALQLNGTSQYASYATGGSLDFAASAPFTVAAWVKTTAATGTIFSHRGSNGNVVLNLNVGNDSVVAASGKLMTLVRDSTGAQYARVTGGTVNDGNWHHVAVTRNAGNRISLFLDGVLQGTDAQAGSGGAMTSALRAIGSERKWVAGGFCGSWPCYFNGAVDDVRIYGRELSGAELADLHGKLAAWWKLDEAAGATSAADSAAGIIGTPTAVTFTPSAGVIGGAATFNGSTSYMGLGRSDSANYGTLNFAASAPFTVSAWVKTSAATGTIFSHRDTTGNVVLNLNVGHDSVVSAPGKLMTLVRDTTGGQYARVTGGTVNDGKWHHVALTRNAGNTITLYLDGVSQGSDAKAGSGGALTSTLRALGSERKWVAGSWCSQWPCYFNGAIDDVRIYRRQLSTSEIQNVARQGSLQCGNGVVNSGEECDLGPQNGQPGVCCTTACRYATGTVCRAAAGDCDLAEVCVSGSTTCPANQLKPQNTPCRPATGDCDLPEFCTGSSVDCPADRVVAVNTVCRDPAGDCDLTDYCDGSSKDCRDYYRLWTEECRPAAGHPTCAPAVSCSGSGPACAPTTYAAAGTPCDTDAQCDGAGLCVPIAAAPVVMYQLKKDSINDYFYTTSQAQYDAAKTSHGFVDASPRDPFVVESTPRSGTTPLYRLWSNSGGVAVRTEHVYTTSATERDSLVAQGYALEGQEGYIYTASGDGRVELHRMKKDFAAGDRARRLVFDAADIATLQGQGWSLDGSLGWVQPKQAGVEGQLCTGTGQGSCPTGMTCEVDPPTGQQVCRSQGNYILYFHGRQMMGTPAAALLQHQESWHHIAFNYNGSSRIYDSAIRTQIKNAFKLFCSDGRRCMATCFSAGCARMLLGMKDAQDEGAVLDGFMGAHAAGSAAGGTEVANAKLRSGIRVLLMVANVVLAAILVWALPASATAAMPALTAWEFANPMWWAARAWSSTTTWISAEIPEEAPIDEDLDPDLMRNGDMGLAQNSAPASVTHHAGNQDICQKVHFLFIPVAKVCGNDFVGGGHGDGIVPMQSACGYVDAHNGRVDCCEAGAKYQNRTNTACSFGKDHSGMYGVGVQQASIALAGIAPITPASLDSYTSTPEIEAAIRRCDSVAILDDDCQLPKWIPGNGHVQGVMENMLDYLGDVGAAAAIRDATGPDGSLYGLAAFCSDCNSQGLSTCRKLSIELISRGQPGVFYDPGPMSSLWRCERCQDAGGTLRGCCYAGVDGDGAALARGYQHTNACEFKVVEAPPGNEGGGGVQYSGWGYAGWDGTQWNNAIPCCWPGGNACDGAYDGSAGNLPWPGGPCDPGTGGQ